LKRLGIIWHSRTCAAQALANAALDGAGHAGRMIRAGEVLPDDILACSGFLFVCPENLGSLTGEMKEMFDRCYYPLLGKVEGRPYATLITAGSDGHGAQAQLDRIVTGWRLRRVLPPQIILTDAQTEVAILAKKSLHNDKVRFGFEFGLAMSAGLESGIF
jgi:multimeric flavodoxin WrbA